MLSTGVLADMVDRTPAHAHLLLVRFLSFAPTSYVEWPTPRALQVALLVVKLVVKLGRDEASSKVKLAAKLVRAEAWRFVDV